MKNFLDNMFRVLSYHAKNPTSAPGVSTAIDKFIF